MAKFFIDRPIFSWVIALFIIILGAVSITKLPISQYPKIAPPTISLSTAYPGANAQTINDSVLSIIENNMNGIAGLDYIESRALSNGTGSLTLTFKTGTNEDLAQIEVQNRLAQVQSRLPAVVRQNGVQVNRSRSNFLLFAMFSSEDSSVSLANISDYVARNVLPEIQRINGVGGAQLFGSEQAMRIWLKPEKLAAFNLSATDISQAITTQNIQISAGGLGELPNSSLQTIASSITIPGQLTNVEEFKNIILRSNQDGSAVRLKDVAEIEIGLQSYASQSRLNGKPAVAIGVQLANDGNALSTAKLVREKLTELQKFFPNKITWRIPHDSSKFVGISIEKVVHTLIEAIVLVFLVMFLFLQNLRYTLIPTIVVPIALLGSFAVMYITGMSINVLTMFAMVLVIGIVVDDAIVVVENVERIMAHERLSPLQASYKAMKQISGAVIGITLVLIAVFIPMAFFSGSTGNIYRQFSIVMAASIFFSAFLALSLTPALCATLLKPVNHDGDKKGFFGWFNRLLTRTTKKYEAGVAYLLRRGIRVLIIYLTLIGVGSWVLWRLPSAFLPNEDQGYLIASVQLPAGATQARTLHSFEQLESIVLSQPEVENMVSILGFSFNGQGQNMGLAFITLKDWSERQGDNSSAASVASRISGAALQTMKDGTVFALTPPSIPGLGSVNGFDFRLQDRANHGHEALLSARNQLISMANKHPSLVQVSPSGLEDAAQLKININRDIAYAQGINMSTIASTLSTILGSNYVGDFLNNGRLQRVILQGNIESRMQPEDILKIYVKNNQGKSVPLSSLINTEWISSPMQLNRYNGYPSMTLSGSSAPGVSSGDAMMAMEELAQKLPSGFGFEWSGQSKQEREAGSQAVMLYAFSIIAVFLCLAALYESWTIPIAVLLVVPLGFLGVVLGIWGRGLSNDIYFQVGLITVIGLSAKNAILIVEFAKDLQAQGYSPFAAALAAAHLRFRPIIMTSLAFIVGVIPLYIASGASAASQHAIGTSVLWGMLVGTILAIFFVPMFYTAVRSWFHHSRRQNKRFTEHSNQVGMTSDVSEHYIEQSEADLSDEDKQYLNQMNKKPRQDEGEK